MANLKVAKILRNKIHTKIKNTGSALSVTSLFTEGVWNAWCLAFDLDSQQVIPDKEYINKLIEIFQSEDAPKEIEDLMIEAFIECYKQKIADKYIEDLMDK